jgi:hypothetical protein
MVFFLLEWIILAFCFIIQMESLNFLIMKIEV